MLENYYQEFIYFFFFYKSNWCFAPCLSSQVCHRYLHCFTFSHQETLKTKCSRVRTSRFHSLSCSYGLHQICFPSRHIETWIISHAPEFTFFVSSHNVCNNQSISPDLKSVLQYDWVMQRITERSSHYYINHVDFNISSINSPIRIHTNNE